MIMRVERFVATLSLAWLCNCATTKPDSTDSPSSLIDLPEQQKHNEDKLTIDERSDDEGETVSETDSQRNTSPDSVPHDQSPKTVSELANSDESQNDDTSVLNQPDAHESKSTSPDSDRPSKPEATETISTVDSQSEISNPSVEGRLSFDSDNASDIDEKPIDPEIALSDNSNAEADLPLRDIFTKDSISGSDSIETDREEGNPSEVNKSTGPKPLDQTDLQFSDSSENLDEPSSSPDVELEFSASDISPRDEPENSENSLAYESENQPESPSSTSPTSDLVFSDSNSEPPDLEGIDSASLFLSEPHDNGTNLEPDKSTSIHLGPRKDTSVAGLTKSPRRYVGLSQWLSRSSSSISSRDDVYLGHSDPTVPVELESYIDESPLVGIRESVPWEYDSIAKLLRPREDASSVHSDEKGFDYETVRKFFGRKNSMGSTKTNVNSTPSASRYDNVLQWFDSRDSTSTPPKAKTPEVRKYSKVLNWIRNEGR